MTSNDEARCQATEDADFCCDPVSDLLSFWVT